MFGWLGRFFSGWVADDQVDEARHRGLFRSRFAVGDTVRAAGAVGEITEVSFGAHGVSYRVGGMWHESGDVRKPTGLV